MLVTEASHLQRKSGRQSMLSVIISTKMQRKQYRKKSTGCWLQKQVDSVLERKNMVLCE